MRVLPALVFVIAGCGAKVATKPLTYDDDLGGKRQAAAATSEAAPQPVREIAPPGKGLRTGTIQRAQLNAVLDAGPARFLGQLEVSAKLERDRFVGWELVQLVDKASPLYDVDVAPGDVLLAINGKPLSRPDQLQTVWDGLRTANELTAQLWRGDKQLTLAFAIEPKL